MPTVGRDREGHDWPTRRLGGGPPRKGTITIKTSVITSIGRPVDLSYPTNRAVAIASALVTLGAALVQRVSGMPWIESGLWGVQAGLAGFLTWALGRELDPDHDLSAFVAFALAVGGLFLWGLPRFSVLLWLMLVVRMVNRTTGLPAGILDSLGILGLGIWLSLEGNWGYSLITTLAFLLDSQLPMRTRRQLAFAVLGAVGTVTTAALSDGLLQQGGVSLRPGLLALVGSGCFVPVILESRTVSSVGDRTGKRLRPVRVRAAQALALLVGVETALLGGIAALGSLTPLWAAVLGASLYRLYRVLEP